MDETSSTQKADRYPGLRPYRPDQDKIFFGRDREKEELFYQSRSYRVVLLFARSGIGKSSLLNAGLTPLLKEAGYLPISVSFTKVKSQDEATPVSPLGLLKLSLRPYATEEILFDNKAPQLWEYFKSCSFSKSSVPVFIFDQFEELFNYKPEEIEIFLLQLSELIHDKPPSRVIRWLLEIETTKRTEEELEWVTQPPVRFIFAIRSDRLAEFQKMDKIIPGVFSNRYHLLPMDERNAAEAIQKPAALDLSGYFESEPFAYDKDSLGKIIGKLKSKYNSEIEPSQLQIVCRYIEDLVIASYKDDSNKGIKLVTTDVFDADREIDTVLHNYYEQQLAQVGNAEEQLLCRRLLENDLLEKGNEGYNRIRLSEGKVKERLHHKEGLLMKLLDTRLLKGETEEKTTYYQISHDSLKDPILESKKLTEEKERTELERVHQLAEAKKLIDEHFKLREKQALDEARDLLKKAEIIYEINKDEPRRIDARIKQAKVLIISSKVTEALNILEETLSQLDEQGDRKLFGLIKEDIGIIYSKLGDKTTALDSFRTALACYEEVKDYALIARLSEHIAAVYEKEIDSYPEKKSDLFNHWLKYYDQALKNYSYIDDTFGYLRLERSKERLKEVDAAKIERGIANPWGYLMELFTGKIFPLKGTGSIRVGRNVYDDFAKKFIVENEIGFPGTYITLSRRHATINPDLTIEDTQSLNGTTINNIPLYYGNPRMLADGDIVVFANILPMRFDIAEPFPIQVPDNCWGILIEGGLKIYHYLNLDRNVYSLRLEQKTAKNGQLLYQFLFTEEDSEEALIKFRWNRNVPEFFVEEKMTILPPKTNGSAPKDDRAVWKIRTTIKEEDRTYKDYILNSGQWYKTLDFPMQPELTVPANKEGEPGTVLAHGPTFQLVIKI